MRLLACALAVLALGLAAGGCGVGAAPAEPAAGPVTTPLRIGVKNFTEQAILGELYRQALVARGIPVELKTDVGSTEIIHRVLRRGALDMYPEYVGVLLSEIAELRSRPREAAAAYALAKRFEQRAGYTLLDPTPFSDANALGVKPAFARRHGLRTIADLAKLRGPVRIAALSEFGTRFEGMDGLREVYGLRNLRIVPVAAEGRYEALERGRADVALVFTTEGQLVGGGYRVLADPRNLFASGHVAPVISARVLADRGPALREAIDAVTTALTTDAMRAMNAAVDLRGRSPAAVAAEFLRSHGLVTG